MARKPATITAILIDPFACTVSHITLKNGDLDAIYAALSHESMPVRTFEVSYKAGLPGMDALFFDEDGNYKGAERGFALEGFHTVLLGKALIIGGDGKSGSADPVTKIGDLKVAFYDIATREITTTPWVAEREYRLGSADMMHAPGIIRWAINAAKFESDREAMVNIVARGWKIPEAAARRLLTCEVPFDVDGETVVFTA